MKIVTCLLTKKNSGLFNYFDRWSKTPVRERSRLMNKIADIVESRLEEFAEAESRDQGKPVWLAKAIDVPRLIHNFRFFASGCLHTIET